MVKTEQKKSLVKLCIDEALYDLKYRYPDFMYPLSLLTWEEYRGENIGGKCLVTDGITVFYYPKQIVRSDKSWLQNEIMHIVMHGLLGHFQIKDHYQKTVYRDLIMDVQVKYLMQKSDIFPDLNQYGMKQIEQMVKEDFSMGQYYRLQKVRGVDRSMEFLQQFCRSDDHSFWDRNPDEEKQYRIAAFWGDVQQAVLGERVDVEGILLSQELSEKIAGKVMNELEKMLAKAGNGRGSETSAFAVGQSGRMNYRDLLKELFAKTEVCREEPDSIDPMFYHYGFELYEDVPLMEPLETCEQVAFQTLAIAIDVSGSCIDKETMESFWGETYRCIAQLKEKHARGQVLLLQCDDGIQKEELLELEELDEMPAKVDVTGFGGTSFVPVFERLQKLEEEGSKVDALIYLTDGEGEYPENKPEYPVYFVLQNESRGGSRGVEAREDIPDWIRKVWLVKEKN